MIRRFAKFKLMLALLSISFIFLLALSGHPGQSGTVKYLEKGTTVFQGKVDTNLWLAYRFNLKAGQQLSVSLKSEKGKAFFTLLTGSGREGMNKAERIYADNAAKVTAWSDELRKTGEYEIEVESANDGPAQFVLEVSVK